MNYVFARLPQLLMWQRDTQVMQLLCHANLSYAKFWISDGLHVIKGRTVTSEMLWSKFPLKHPRTCWSPAELTAIFQWRKHWNTELSQTEDRHKSNTFLKKFPHHFLKLHLRFSIRKSPANFCLILNPSLFCLRSHYTFCSSALMISCCIFYSRSTWAALTDNAYSSQGTWKRRLTSTSITAAAASELKH